MKRSAVFLNRDGVINRYAYDPKFGSFDSPAHPEDFELLPGVGQAIASLSRLNLPVIVISNQPGIADGRFTPCQLDAINEEMRLQLAQEGARIDALYYCRHHPDAAVKSYRADCDCRKPKPGMLLRAARERNIDLQRSFLVGDGMPDILAGRALGITTLLLCSPHCAACEEFASHGAVPDFYVRDLRHAVQVIAATLFGGHFPAPDFAHRDQSPCAADRPSPAAHSRAATDSPQSAAPWPAFRAQAGWRSAKVIQLTSPRP